MQTSQRNEQEPDRRRQQKTAETRSDKEHPATRPGQKMDPFGACGDHQIGEGQSQAEGRENHGNVQGCPCEGEGDRRPEEGCGARRCKDSGEEAGAEIRSVSRSCAAGSQAVLHGLRQGYFERTEEVCGEDCDHDKHETHENGVLKLHAPADRNANPLERQQDRRETPNECQNTEGGHQKPFADDVAGLARCPRKAMPATAISLRRPACAPAMA